MSVLHFRLAKKSILILILILFAIDGWIPALPGANQHIDIRRAERSNADTSAARRLSAEILRKAVAELGTGLVPSFSDSGRLRALARHPRPLSSPDVRDAEVIGRAFARDHGYVFGVDDAWIRNLELTARDKTGRNTLLKFRQQWAGIPVFQSELRVHVSPAGEVVEVDFQLEPLPPPNGSPERLPSIAATAALSRCLENLEPELRNLRTEVREQAQGARRRTRLRFGQHADEVTAQWAWFPVGGELHLAWHFDAVSPDSQAYYECLVDARDGTLLYRSSITDSEVIGLVFETPSPQPSTSPGILPPFPNPPDLVQRTWRSFAGNPIASPAGWVGPGNETIGNNVIAREDKAGDNETTLGATAKTVDGLFGFDLKLGPDSPGPVEYTAAAITNLFFWCNLAHDYFFSLGFGEAAGNFQEDNFGSSGLGGDALRADAQDGIALSPPNLNNANMSTPVDGSRPRMQMYLWGTLGGPYVDSSLDAEVILHEYTHGVFRRLTPTIGGVQGGAMNEGNSDFFALNYLMPASASPDGSFVAAGYSEQDFVRGIRSRPYSTDLAVNDLSYADFGRVRSYPEVHADGEIWVEAMWELRSRLIKKLGYEEARRRVAQLMIDAMKRSPANPSFVDMRDALITADQANHGGADIDLLWEAFARRGLGFMAAGGTGSSLRVLPSQAMPSAAGRVRFFDDLFYVGESIRVYVGDSNNPDSTLALSLISTGGDRETLAFTRSGALYQASIPTASGVPAKDDGTLQVAPGNTVRASYHDADDGFGISRDVTVEAEIRLPYVTDWEPGGLTTLPETALNMKGDNLTKSYSLPFGFPFYDRLTTSIYVTTNGLITIGTSNSSGVNSESALTSRVAIAPLWMDLRTDGIANPGEDVYVATPTPDSIRFRWAAETTGRYPVNFAATLFRNGDIVFSYGSGNQRVTPTVGISRGNDATVQTFTNYSSRDSRQTVTLENVTAIRWLYSGNRLSTTIFPFLKTTDSQYTGFAVVNCGDKPADIFFTAQQDSGQALTPAIDPKSIYLAGGAQSALVSQQLFPSLPSDFNGWVKAQSTESRLATFFLTGDISQTYLSGALAPARLSSDLIFTHLPTGQGSSTTSLYLVNPGGVVASLELAWYDAEGVNPISVTREIAPGSRLAAEVSTLFPSLPRSFKNSYLRIKSNTAIAGVAVSEGSDGTKVIAAQEPSTATSQYAAQFASGNLGATCYVTDVNLVNSSSARRTLSIQLVGNEGIPLAAPHAETLEPGGQLHLPGDQLFGLPDPITGGRYFEGTLTISADGGGVVGDITFGDARTQRFSATLPLDSALSSDQMFAQVAEGQAGYFTGIAMFNPNAADIGVQVQVFHRTGILAGKADLTLKPNRRISRTLSQLIPGLSQLGGYIRVISKGGPIASFAVYGDSLLNYLVAIPPQFINP